MKQRVKKLNLLVPRIVKLLQAINKRVIQINIKFKLTELCLIEAHLPIFYCLALFMMHLIIKTITVVQ